MIILKIFGQKNHMISKFNRDKYRVIGMDVNEETLTIKNDETVIYYKSATENLDGFRANFIETYGEGSISPRCWELIRRMLK